MSLSGLRWWHYLVGIVGGLTILLLLVSIFSQNVFRFRMTLEIEADGKVHSGSSVIQVTYSEGGPNTRRWVTSHKGVTPMVDLGRHGTVMPLFRYRDAPFADRLAAVGRPVNRSTGEGVPQRIDDVPIAAYNVTPNKLSWWLEKIEVPIKYLPALVWIPRGAHWRSAGTVLPEEMPDMIHASVRFVRMTIEPASWAALATKIEPAPDWLEMMRIDNRTIHGVRSGQFNFHPLFVESEYHP
jgi:hypothetical protein